MKHVIIAWLLLTSQVLGESYIQNITKDNIKLNITQSYQTQTTIGSTILESNSQTTFGIKLPIKPEVYTTFMINFFNLTPKNSVSNRNYKIRAIIPGIEILPILKHSLSYHYGIQLPLNIIAYKNSGTIDNNDHEYISFGIEPYLGSTLFLSKSIVAQVQVSLFISYLPKLVHKIPIQTNTFFILPKVSISLNF